MPLCIRECDRSPSFVGGTVTNPSAILIVELSSVLSKSTKLRLTRIATEASGFLCLEKQIGGKQNSHM